MKLLSLSRPRRVSDYTDAELEAMTWIELSELCSLTASGIAKRVKRWKVSRRAAVLGQCPPRERPPLYVAAEQAGLPPDTVRSRVRRNGGDLAEALSYPRLSTWSRKKRHRA